MRIVHDPRNQTLYDECDGLGLVVCVEIPPIREGNGSAGIHESSLQQMKELISQCYNHPSICFWDLTMGLRRVQIRQKRRQTYVT
ncbi:MAG: hypothetical protein LIO86_05215 [Lachnospiraceae bacterium]|nr:hypothetical protein [Lachnospiraceae bacterium]